MPNTLRETSKDEISDKRYFPRWEVSNRVLFQLEDNLDTIEATTKDLSCAGTCILSKNHDFQLNKKVKLVIYLSPGKFISITGKIVWLKPLVQLDEVGIQFEDVTLKAQDTILQHAFEIRHNDLVRNWYRGWRA